MLSAALVGSRSAALSPMPCATPVAMSKTFQSSVEAPIKKSPEISRTLPNRESRARCRFYTRINAIFSTHECCLCAQLLKMGLPLCPMSPKSEIKSIKMGPGGIKMEAKSIKMRPWLLWEALGPPVGSRSGPGEHRVPDVAGIFNNYCSKWGPFGDPFLAPA